MVKALPGKKGWWGHIKDGLSDLFWGTRSSRMVVDVNRENNQNLIAYYEERDRLQQQIEAGRMHLQIAMQDKSLGFQANEGRLNRELQEHLARLNQAFNATEGKLNRELQAEMARLNREFQANEGKLNRKHANQIELFRAQLQMWIQERQRELQIQLSDNQATLQRELAIYHRETSLVVIRQQRQQQNWPLTLDEDEIIQLMNSKSFLVLFSPPTLRNDRAGNRNQAAENFPDMEYRLGQGLRGFLDKYTQSGRPVKLQSGVWISKAFHSEGANTSLFRGLRPISTVFLDVLLEGSTYHLNCGTWDSTSNEPDLKSIPNDPDLNPDWKQFLEDSNEDDLRRFLSVQLYLLAGLKADKHFLLNLPPHERQRPLLPELLPNLLEKVPEEYREDVIEMVVSGCIAMYGVLEKEESAWVPELKLDLALSLSVLEDKSWSKEQLRESLQSWLQLRGLSQPEGRQALLDAVEANLTIADDDFVRKLNQCLEATGESRQLDVADAYYCRGVRRCEVGEWELALSDFDWVLQINPHHAKAYINRGVAHHELGNYEQALRDFLSGSDWEKANDETLKLLLHLAGRENEKYLQLEDVAKISCKDIRIIDDLWSKHSNSHFGFSSQVSILNEVSDRLGTNSPTLYETFAERVGWLEQKHWIAYKHLSFNISALKGHLPSWAAIVGLHTGLVLLQNAEICIHSRTSSRSV